MDGNSQLVTGVDFVPLTTQDLAAANDFYGTTLGLRRSAHNAERGFAEFETGNLTLSIIEAAKMGLEHHVNRNAIALHVDDVADARERLETKGVKFEGEILDTGVCHMSWFADSDGNALMLHHRYAPRTPEA